MKRAVTDPGVGGVGFFRKYFMLNYLPAHPIRRCSFYNSLVRKNERPPTGLPPTPQRVMVYIAPLRSFHTSFDLDRTNELKGNRVGTLLSISRTFVSLVPCHHHHHHTAHCLINSCVRVCVMVVVVVGAGERRTCA